MTINELDHKLNDALITFSGEIRSSFSEGSKEPATEGDIAEASKQAFYALDTFREEIIKYLKSN